jgi:hypothetical protein
LYENYPRWRRAECNPRNDCEHVLLIVNAGTLAIKLGPITCIGSIGEWSSTIDLVIGGLGHGIDSLSVLIAEDIPMGSYHEVMTWDLFADDQILPTHSIDDHNRPTTWKLRASIKTDDKDELKE